MRWLAITNMIDIARSPSSDGMLRLDDCWMELRTITAIRVALSLMAKSAELLAFVVLPVLARGRHAFVCSVVFISLVRQILLRSSSNAG